MYKPVTIFSSILILTLFTVLTGVNAESEKPALSLPPNNGQVTLGVTPVDKLGSNEAGVGLKVGDKVPNFAITTHLGEPIAFAELLQQGPLMVVFYRGGWCPYCNVQIRQLTLASKEFSKRGITPVLISVDKPDAALLAQATYEIPFPVLSDPDLKAHTAFDVILEVDEQTLERYKEYDLSLESWSGRSHHKIAVPSVFIVDKTGTVQWAHTSKDIKTRPSAEQLLEVLDS